MKKVLHLVGCLHRCTSGARSHKRQVPMFTKIERDIPVGCDICRRCYEAWTDLYELTVKQGVVLAAYEKDSVLLIGVYSLVQI